MCRLCEALRGRAGNGDSTGWHELRGEASPFGWSPVSRYAITGGANDDSLLAGSKWGGPRGSGVTLEYSFPSWNARWSSHYGDGEPRSGFAPLNSAQKAAVRDSLERWSDVANIRFVEVADTSGRVGDLRFGVSSAPDTAWAYYPGQSPEAGDVWLGRASHGGQTNYKPGTYHHQTVLHEIGHAIGLKHPHDGGGVVAKNDWLGVSVMSYRSYPGDSTGGAYSNDFFPTTPMLWDIEAIQALYGANKSTAAGDTVYRWSPGERIFETIWDGGGKDTIDWSNQSRAAAIDLEAGSWSQLGTPYTWRDGGRSGSTPDTLAIAKGVTIENARGGRGNDTIDGNAAANSLYGNNGNDHLDGEGGNDRLYGDAGNDKLTGGSGVDILQGGSGADIFVFDDGDTRVGSGKRDRILDMHRSEGDRIDLRAIDADATRGGDQAFAWKGTGELTGAAQLRYYKSGDKTIIQGSTDKDRSAEIEIELAGSLKPGADWFLL
jgi:Ca2+-binding RTX toxin-like protein